MEIKKSQTKIFKIKNRTGYAAIFANYLTEGKTAGVAYDRLVKALKRKTK